MQDGGSSGTLPGPLRGARRQLAGGTLKVSVGLGVTGLGTVVMMALTARALPADEYAGFAVWWTVATLLGTCFGVFEAYLARLVVTERSSGRSSATVTGLLTGRAALVVGGLSVCVLVTAPLLGSRLFAGHLDAALVLPVFMALTAAQAIQRGSATGRRNFLAMAAQLSCDGVLRVVLVGALVALDVQSVFTLALACCGSAAASLMVGGRLCPGWIATPRLRGAEAAIRPIVYLLVGSVGPLLANNGSVPWLAGTDSVDAYTLGAFAAAVTLSRIPTQFVSAVFSPLLAHLAQAVDSNDEATFRHLRRSAALVAVVLGVVYVIAFAALGPWFLSVYLGPGYRLGVLNLAVLATASSVMFVAAVEQAGLAALDRWPRIAAAWGVGTVGFLVILLVPGETLWRATAAPLGGVLAALVSLMVLGRGAWMLRGSGSVSDGEVDGRPDPV